MKQEHARSRRRLRRAADGRDHAAQSRSRRRRWPHGAHASGLRKAMTNAIIHISSSSLPQDPRRTLTQRSTTRPHHHQDDHHPPGWPRTTWGPRAGQPRRREEARRPARACPRARARRRARPAGPTGALRRRVVVAPPLRRRVIRQSTTSARAARAPGAAPAARGSGAPAGRPRRACAPSHAARQELRDGVQLSRSGTSATFLLRSGSASRLPGEHSQAPHAIDATLSP